MSKAVLNRNFNKTYRFLSALKDNRFIRKHLCFCPQAHTQFFSDMLLHMKERSNLFQVAAILLNALGSGKS